MRPVVGWYVHHHGRGHLARLFAIASRLDADIRRRAVLSRRYDDRLRGLPGVRAVPGDAATRSGEERVVYVHLVEVDDRDGLVAHLDAAGIGTEVYYPRPLHLQPCFAHLGYRPGALPRAEAVCRSAVALPLYADLSEERVDRVCDEVERFLTGGSR